MNEIFSPKADQLQKNLATLNAKLAQSILRPNDSEIRSLIDSRRFCLAQLQSERIEQNQTKPKTSANQITNFEIDNFINVWCSRIKSASENSKTFEDETFCNQFLDYALPKIWHFDNDIVVVISPPSTKIVHVFVDFCRIQNFSLFLLFFRKRIIVFIGFPSECKKKMEDG